MLTNKLFCKCSVSGLPSGKILPTFKLPNMFRQDVQMKLDAEAIILPSEIAAVLREVASSIQQFTYKPTSQDLNLVVQKLACALYYSGNKR